MIDLVPTSAAWLSFWCLWRSPLKMVSGLAQHKSLFDFIHLQTVVQYLREQWKCFLRIGFVSLLFTPLCEWDSLCVYIYLSLSLGVWKKIDCRSAQCAPPLFSSVCFQMCCWCSTVSKPALSEVCRCKQPQPWYLEKAKQNAKCISLNCICSNTMYLTK